jgi:SpoIVB peptidase S55
MSRSWLLACLLLGAFPGVGAPAEHMPLDAVRPGMTGIGRTVFEGSRIEDFRVTVLGVLHNVGPRRSLVLARLEGGPLERTGVIAGMSGSPVYIDGRLLGAVSYGFPFSKETIAGITPIGEMIEATRSEAPRAASARYRAPSGSRGLAFPVDAASLAEVLRRPLPSVAPTLGLPGAALPASLTGQSLTPLSLPIAFAGFAPEAFDWARSLFAGLGFSPVLGAAGALPPEASLPDLEPGAAVGVSLLDGDMDVSVTGTVTEIEDGRVYAFGHPFYNLGPTQFPMKKAYVYSVFPSLYQSWKISAAFEPVGTMDQDRTAAISGRLGKTPRMIPVEVHLATSRGQEREFSFRMVDDELFTPVLAYVSLLSALQASERAFGTSTIRLDARLLLSGGREVRVQDLFTEDQPVARASALVAAPLAYLLGNEFERVGLEKVEVNASSFEEVQSASLQRAWLEPAGPLRPGSSVPLRIQLRSYRGETLLESIPVSIPDNAQPGRYQLLVADAASITALEQREMRQAFVPRDLDQLVRAINALRSSDKIYARLMRDDSGAIVSGEYLPTLPPSALAVLGAGDPSGDVAAIGTTAVWSGERQTAYAFSGSRVLSLSVER